MSVQSNSFDLVGCPDAARPVLARYLGSEISAEIALMQLLLALGGMTQLHECLAAARGHAAIRALEDVMASNEAALEGAARLVESGLTRERTGDISTIREQFDRAVAISPEAAVALYSLGSAATLERATAELVGRLDEWQLLGPDVTALDIGCGIGRLEAALASRLRAMTGIDISPGMIAVARKRGAGLANVDFAVCDGTGLASLAGRKFDLVLAVDAFPYLVAADPALAERHIADAAPLLSARGAFAILNFSYRGDLDADRRAVAALAQRHGFAVIRNGTRDFALWDGATFLLRRMG